MYKLTKWIDVDYSYIESVLGSGQAILSESDTVLGLFAQTNLNGFERLNIIKGRKDKPYLILISSIEDLKKFSDCNFGDQLNRLINYCWPGPLTLVLKAKKNIPDYLISSNGTIAIRLPKHKYLLDLIKKTGPLFSTSANLVGMPIPSTLNDVDPSILNQINIVISNDADVEYGTVPSTILDCSGPKIVVIREGAYDIDTLERVSGDKIFREK